MQALQRMPGSYETTWLRGPFPMAEKQRLDRFCLEMRLRHGMHYGETVAACLLVGLRSLQSSGNVPYNVLATVRGF